MKKILLIIAFAFIVLGANAQKEHGNFSELIKSAKPIESISELTGLWVLVGYTYEDDNEVYPLESATPSVYTKVYNSDGSYKAIYFNKTNFSSAITSSGQIKEGADGGYVEAVSEHITPMYIDTENYILFDIYTDGSFNLMKASIDLGGGYILNEIYIRALDPSVAQHLPKNKRKE